MDTGLQCRAFLNDGKPFPQFCKPRVVGFFSVDSDRDYEPNAKQLRYYKTPAKDRFPLDLNEGLDLAVRKPESAYDECLDNMLKFIVDNLEKLNKPNKARPPAAEGPLIGPEFVCWRGLLRLIMCSPYEQRDDWCIYVTKYMGTCYLCKRDTEKDKYQRSMETKRQRVMSAYGFKFEQFCLVESPQQDPDTSVPVNECEEFSCVFRTTMGGFDMLYGAEMDGIISDCPIELNNTKLDDLKFVEVKVRQNNLNAHQYRSYVNHKSRNWWCQSFLVGIQDIYVGLRSEQGMVQRIEHVDVRSLTKLGNYWTATACANFLQCLLKVLQGVMKDVNCPYSTYAFKFNAHQGTISYDIIDGKSQYSFLPDWYIAKLQQLKKKHDLVK